MALSIGKRNWKLFQIDTFSNIKEHKLQFNLTFDGLGQKINRF